MRSTAPVRYSEQNTTSLPLETLDGTELDGQPGQMRTDGFVRTGIIKNAIFRDQVQAALSELVRGYEVTTGLSVIRVLYQAETRRFSIEAIPAR
jgi:hypothetical protein